MDAEHYTIERIIDGKAVCTTGGGAIRRIPLEQVPEGAAEGVVLTQLDGAYVVDEELTELNRRYMESEFFYEHEAADPEGRVGMDSMSGADLGGFGMGFGGAGEQGGQPGAPAPGAPGMGGFGGPGMGGPFGM